jgi:acid stress-induced BolA-like protein IbaG/YrbA
MKEKILSSLKTKYKNLGFGDKSFDGVADYLAKTVKEETDIETAIDGVEPLLKVFQSESDRRATELQTKTKELQEQIETLKKVKPGEEPKPDDVNTQIKALRDELEGLRKLDKQRGVQAKFTEQAKAKKIPSLLIEGVQVDSEDEIEGVLTKLEEKAKALKQELINEGLIDKPPARGSGAASSKEQIANDIKANPVIKK